MQTIDIRTTQNVTIEYELASVRERILAFFIDLLIVGVLYVILLLAFMGLFSRSDSLFLSVFFGLLPILLLTSYQFVSELLADGRSWGKKALGLKVVRLDGRQAGLTDYFLRAVFLLVEAVFGLGIPAAILISTTANNQRLGDMTANTTVVRIRNRIHFNLQDILNIESIEAYQPQFPQVQQLREEDMLLIKSALARFRTYRNEAHREAIQLLAQRLRKVLGVSEARVENDLDFLKTLLRDYIVLTR